MVDPAIQIKPYSTRQQAALAIAVIAQQNQALLSIMEHDPELLAEPYFYHAINELGQQLIEIREAVFHASCPGRVA